VPLTVENRARGWKRLAAALRRADIGRVGIEATGGYERGVVAHLRGAGFVVTVLQPLQTKAYARLHLRRAKNASQNRSKLAAMAITRAEQHQRIPPLAA
jgi:transposase